MFPSESLFWLYTRLSCYGGYGFGYYIIRTIVAENNSIKWRTTGELQFHSVLFLCLIRNIVTRRGSSVYVSVPLFKTCGHFSVVVDNHKYELRLAGSGDPVPIYHSRVLQEEERSHFEDATFTFQWMHVGWTHFTHEERETRLRAVMDGFGPYNLFRNNCRHFVQAACQSVLHIVARTDAMFEVEVMTQTALALAFYYLARPMLVQRDEFIHFIFICVLGPGTMNAHPFRNC